jgi:hypothetical protein
MCYPIWLFSRKYGTVWYHPASSKLWYLTALPFVDFQEKLTGTSFALCACEASFVRLAVWLALSALFASTLSTQTSPWSRSLLITISFIAFCWCGAVFNEERERKHKTPSLTKKPGLHANQRSVVRETSGSCDAMIENCIVEDSFLTRNPKI